MSDKGRNAIDRIYSNLQSDPSESAPDDMEELRDLHAMAESLKSTAEFLSNPHTGFNAEFITPPVAGLWDRYFQLRLLILKKDPDTVHLNQGERCDRISEEMKKFSVSEKSESTKRRWDALSEGFFISNNSH